MVFWDNVNRILKLKRLTQSDLAENIGVSLQTLRGWVSKEIEPRVSDAIKISAYLGSSVESLNSNGSFGGINDIYAWLDKDNKDTVRHLAEWLLERQRNKKP